MSEAIGTIVLTKDDFKAVLKAVYPAREKWWWIGLELGIDDDELDSIKGKDEECLKTMISNWLQKRSLNPTWQSLVNALREKTVGHEDVAYDIVMTFMTAEGMDATATGPPLVKGSPINEHPQPDTSKSKDPETGEGYQGRVPGKPQDPPPGYLESDPEVDGTTTKEQASCPKHPGERFNFYCEKCQALICNRCTTDQHKGHQCVLVADAFPKHLEAVEEALQDLDKCTEEIKNLSTKIKPNTVENFYKLRRALDQRHMELTKQFDNLTTEKLSSLAAQREQIELLKTKISGCLEYTEESLEGDTLAKLDPERLRSLETADIQHVRDYATSIAEACHNLATFLTTDSIQCYATGTGLRMATVGEEAEVSLHVKDKEGKGVEVQTEDIDVRLVRYSCSVKSVGKGEYKLHYKPNTRGQHHLNIMIKGRQMRETTHTVVVRPQLQDIREPAMVVDNVMAPNDITIDSKRRIIVSEADEYRVRILSPEGKEIQSFGSEGAGEGQFKHPYGVTVDRDDNIYVADYRNDCVQKFTPNGEHLASVGCRGSKLMEFNSPYHIAFSPRDGRLYICDKDNDRIQILDANLQFCGAIFGRREGKGKFSRPQGVAFDGDGNMYITCGEQIQVFSPKGEYSGTICGGRRGPGQLRDAVGIAVDHELVYVTDRDSNRVSIFTTTGKFLHSFGSKGKQPGQFKNPQGIMIDENGYILVVDEDNYRIQIF